MLERAEVATKAMAVVKKIGIFGLPVVFVLALLLASHTRAVTLATTHQPDRFTELYFPDPTSLPTEITAGKTYVRTFTIASHEPTADTFTYQVTVTDARGNWQQALVTLTLAAGQRFSPQFTYRTETVHSPVTVTVTLLNNQQSIHFHTRS